MGGGGEGLPAAAPLAWHRMARPLKCRRPGQRVRAALPDKLQGGDGTVTSYLMTVTLSRVIRCPTSVTSSIDTMGYDFVTYLLCFREFTQ